MKYIRLFFTTLGYLTFIVLVGAAAFWYIGMKRAGERAAANPERIVTFQDNTVPLTPATTEAPAIEPAEPTLREFAPISRPAAPDRLVDPTPATRPAKKKPIAAAKPAPKKPAPKTAPKPVVYTLPVAQKPAPKAAPKPKPISRPAKRRAQPQEQVVDLPPTTLAWRATDKSANQRTGGKIDFRETTELEKQVIRRMKAIKEIEEAHERLKNPPVWESGVLKFLTGTDQ